MEYLGCEHRFSPPERPKATIGRLLSVAPDIISYETDMLPGKRRDVRHLLTNEGWSPKRLMARTVPQGGLSMTIVLWRNQLNGNLTNS
jgi:hypothetical protein